MSSLFGVFYLAGVHYVLRLGTGFSSQGRAKLHAFPRYCFPDYTQLCPSLTRRPGTYLQEKICFNRFFVIFHPNFNFPQFCLVHPSCLVQYIVAKALTINKTDVDERNPLPVCCHMSCRCGVLEVQWSTVTVTADSDNCLQ